MKAKAQLKRLLACLLAAVMLFTLCFSASAESTATDTRQIESITAKLSRPLYYDFDGEWVKTANGDAWFRYDLDMTVKDITVFTVTFEDKSTKVGKWQEICADGLGYYGTDPFGYVHDVNTEESPLKIGDTVKIECTFFTEEQSFSVPCNVQISDSPIELLGVRANDPLVVDAAGEMVMDFNTYEYYYHYDPAYTDPTINYIGEQGATYYVSLADIEAEYGIKVKFETDQSSTNPWKEGTHTATANIMGSRVDFELTLTPSKITGISAVATRDAYLGIDTNDCYEYLENGEEIIWKRYSIVEFKPEITVTYEGGFELKTDWEKISAQVNNSGAFEECDQSYLSPWNEVGEYTYGIRLCQFGDPENTQEFTCEFTVKIIPNPIKSITATATRPVMAKEYNYVDENGEPLDESQGGGYRYYYYDGSPLKLTVTFADNSVRTMLPEELSKLYNDKYPYMINTKQSIITPWQEGENTAEFSMMGHTCEYTVHVVEELVSDIRVISAEPLMENKGGWTNWVESGEYYHYNYDNTAFVLEITAWNGMFQTTVSNCNNYIEGFGWVIITDTQSQTPWTIGGQNLVTFTYEDDYKNTLTATYNMQISKSNDEYDYRVTEDGAVITSYLKTAGESLVIPETVDGFKVVGIECLSGKVQSVKTLTLPNGLLQLSDYAFSSCESLEEVIIGTDVKQISESAFMSNEALKKITVSEQNNNYCTVDSALYTKNKDTLVAIPLNIGKMHMIPNDEVDISILTRFSAEYSGISYGFVTGGKNFLTEDGITYTADKSQIVSCDPARSGELVIPNTVYSLAAGTFAGCSKLTSVTIPESISEIVYCAFMDCTSLTEVNLPQGLESISGWAFANCSALTKFDIPESITFIGDKAFYSTGLTEVSLPDSEIVLGVDCFSKTKVTSLDFGDNLTCIDYAFRECEQLKSVTLHKNLSHHWSFEDCSALSSVTLEDGIKSVDVGAFSGCIALKSINIPSSVLYIGSSAFYCSGLTEITIPDSVESMGHSVFAYCPSLKTVNIGDGIAEIPSGTFSGCMLTTINWGENVTALGKHSFVNSAITSIELPNTVTTVMYGAFAGSRDLADVELPTSLTRVGPHAFDKTVIFTSAAKGPVYVDDVLYRYKGDVTAQTTVTVRNGTRLIADLAFEHVPYEYDWYNEFDPDLLYDLSGITEIKLPASVEYIGDGAFFELPNLKQVNIPDSVKRVGRSCFISSVTKINVGKTTAELNPEVFVGTSYLESIDVDPASTKYASLDGVLYSKDMTTLIYCPSAKTGTITVPATVTSLVDGAFSYSNLDAVVFKSPVVENLYGGFCNYSYYHDFDYDNYEYYLMGHDSDIVIKGIADSDLHSAAISNGHDFEAITVIAPTPPPAGEENNPVFEITVTETAAESLPANTVLEVESLPAEEEHQVVFDITLKSEGEVVQPEAPVTVSVPLPEGFTERVKVYRIEQDGTKTDMNATCAGGIIYFTTEHFSVYMIEAVTFTPGNINGDENDVVDLQDVVVLAQYVAGWENVDHVEEALDVNGDGNVDLQDVVHLAQYVAGWDVTLSDGANTNTDLDIDAGEIVN